MNLRRFWISVGAITTFVVGVSFVAYATGKFTSEASDFTLSDDQNLFPETGGAIGSAINSETIDSANGEGLSAFDTMADATSDPIPQSVTLDPSLIGTGTDPESSEFTGEAPIPTTVFSAEDVQRIGEANDAASAAEAAANAPGATAADRANATALRNTANQIASSVGGGGNSGSSNTKTKGKTLNPIKEAPAVQLKSFLQDNFASVDSILRIGIPRLLVSFAGLVTLIIFLINAVKFLFGAGNEKSTTEAKQGMAFAGIGFGIVIAAYLIVSFAASIFK